MLVRELSSGLALPVRPCRCLAGLSCLVLPGAAVGTAVCVLGTALPVMRRCWAYSVLQCGVRSSSSPCCARPCCLASVAVCLLIGSAGGGACLLRSALSSSLLSSCLAGLLCPLLAYLACLALLPCLSSPVPLCSAGCLSGLHPRRSVSLRSLFAPRGFST